MPTTLQTRPALSDQPTLPPGDYQYRPPLKATAQPVSSRMYRQPANSFWKMSASVFRSDWSVGEVVGFAAVVIVTAVAALTTFSLIVNAVIFR
jgi:hypothetical protein